MPTVSGPRRDSGMRQPDPVQVTPSGGEHAHDAAGDADTVLDHLRAVRIVFGKDFESEHRLVVSLVRSNGEADRRVVDVHVLRGAAHGLSQRCRVAHRNRQRTEDPNVLALGQTETEVRAGQVTSRALQQSDDGSEADQGGGLIERRALDLRRPQQTDRVAPQLGDQLSIAPQGLHPHHGAHLSTSRLCRQ